MTQGKLVRVQPDLYKEINECEGGSFSEKIRNWRMNYVMKEIRETMKMLETNDMLTKSDVREAVEEAMPSGAYR